jgi:hypothetical protein
MTDEELDRLGAELHRRVGMLIDAHRTLMAAEASDDAGAISQAEETTWQAALALAEPAKGNMAQNRMARAIEHLDNQGDDPVTDQRRGLLALGRFLTDMRSLGVAAVTDVAVADTLRQLNGEVGQLLRPVKTGRGPKGYDKTDLNLIRRYVLRVLVYASQDDDLDELLNLSWPAPTPRQFRREWAPRCPSDEQSMATEIGKALRAGQPLDSDQQALWDEIKNDDPRKLAGYVLKVDPKTVLGPTRR